MSKKFNPQFTPDNSRRIELTGVECIDVPDGADDAVCIAEHMRRKQREMEANPRLNKPWAIAQELQTDSQ
ncbi:MAG: hypothetical protein LAN36_11470 [Acidobacteriia bacterium]|nr:hypothetical protein [Terriglobia bacterium]